MTTNFWCCFFLQIAMYMLTEKIFVLLISQPVRAPKLFITFVFTRVPSSQFPPRAAIDRKPWFTGAIEHRISNSMDQSERA